MTGLRHSVRHHPFVLLFVALLAYVLIQPLFLTAGRDGVLACFSTLVLIAAMVAVSDTVRSFAIGIVLGLPLFLVLWGTAARSLGVPVPLITDPVVVRMHIASGMAFHGYVSALMLRHVSRSSHVSLNSLSGAACVYMLAGVAWGFAFELVELFSPGSFQIADIHLASPGGAPSLELFMYFSFTTLTTLGYGEIWPVHPVARGLANLEAIFGVLFTTVVIARFVGLYLTEARFERRPRNDGAPRTPTRGHDET